MINNGRRAQPLNIEGVRVGRFLGPGSAEARLRRARRPLPRRSAGFDLEIWW
jgi:hypothetical protein